MAGQVLPTETAEAAAEALAALTRRRLPAGEVGDAFFAHDWAPLWDALAEGGWTGLADGPQPGVDGDLSLRDLAAVAEAWGAFLVPLPLVETLVARRWAASRPPGSVRLSHAVAGGRGRLAPFAETCELVLAATPAGLELAPRATLGTALDVDGFAASLPISRLPGGAASPAGAAAADAAALAAATAVGAAAAVLARSVEYAKARHQFGRPIGSFQAVKHRLADMHCRVELARSAVAWACGEPEAAGLAARHAAGLCLRVAEDAVQVHGGIGYTWEAPVHRYLRQVISLRRLVVAATPD